MKVPLDFEGLEIVTIFAHIVGQMARCRKQRKVTARYSKKVTDHSSGSPEGFFVQ